MPAINVGHLIQRRDEIKAILEPENRAALRRELVVINQLIVLTDPARDDPDIRAITPGRRNKFGNLEGRECFIEGCHLQALGKQERCKPHHQRWLKSAEYEGTKGAVACDMCEPNVGVWHKSRQGLIMHMGKTHGVGRRESA